MSFERSRWEISEGLAVVHFLVVKLRREIDPLIPSGKQGDDAFAGKEVLGEFALDVALDETLLKRREITSEQTPGRRGKAPSRNTGDHVDLARQI